MKKLLSIFFILAYSFNVNAWWDAGHLVTAMIAYHNLNESAKKQVDELTKVLQRDYPYVNHFIAAGAWPDDLKAEGVRTYDSWHYTNMFYNPSGLALPPKPKIDVIWAINQMLAVLDSKRARPVDQARHLAFLVHFAGDLHQPLHSTSMFSNSQPAGNIGGNDFKLQGKWSNLHQLWDDGCGYLSSYNDINPYGTPKKPLSKKEIKRIQELAFLLMEEFPKEQLSGMDILDPDFWALESHKLAIKFGYRGVVKKTAEGRNVYIEQNDEPSNYYLEEARKVVKKRLVMGGYRLAELLNQRFRD